jgi:hypothetical protein
MSDIIRRDPRAEWIARNRLHPLHAAMQPAQHSWMGPNGVIRKNPHGIGFIGPNGIKRIDRSGAQQGGAASARPPLKCSCRCIRCRRRRSTSPWCRTWSAAA